MPPTIQDTLLDLFDHVRLDPDTPPTVPIDDWQEGSVEWRLLSGFHDMLEQVQQRMQKFMEMEQQLREKESQYRSIFEATSDGLFITDFEDGHLVEVNPMACRMHGYDYEEFIALHPTAFIHPDSHHIFAEYIQTVKTGGQFHGRAVDLRKDGTTFPIEVYGTTFTYMGSPHVLGIVRDITKQAQAEQQLREKEEQYRSIFEATSDGLIIRDMDGYVVEANPAASSMHGYSYEEFIGLHRTDIIDPADHTMVAEYMKAIQAGRSFQGQAVDLRKDGSAFPVEVRGSTFMYLGKPHTLSVLRDITERVQAEEQLREKEAQYRGVFEAASDAMVITNLDGFVIEANPAACKMYGYTYEELLGLHRTILTHQEYHDMVPESIKTVKAGGHFQARTVDRHKDGTPFPVDGRGTPFIYKGQPTILAVIRDITEQVQAEEQLREKEAQYRGVFEATTDGLVILDPDGFYVEANPAMCSLFGYTHEELIGLHTSALTSPESLDVLTASMEKIKGGRGFQAEGLALRKDGTVFYSEAHLTPFTYQGKPHLLAATHDITERVQAQQLLEQRVEDRTRELSSLLEISHTMASTLQLKPLLGLILDQLKTVVDYTGSSILTLEGADLVFLDSRSPIPGEQLMQLRFPLKNLRLIWKTITSRESIIIQDVREDSPLAYAFRVALGELLETTFH